MGSEVSKNQKHRPALLCYTGRAGLIFFFLAQYQCLCRRETRPRLWNYQSVASSLASRAYRSHPITLLTPRSKKLLRSPALSSVQSLPIPGIESPSWALMALVSTWDKRYVALRILRLLSHCTVRAVIYSTYSDVFPTTVRSLD